MWFRRDLRLADNPALVEAANADEVVPLFVFDPRLWVPAGPSRRSYLLASLDALDPDHPYSVAQSYAERIPSAELVSEEPGSTPLAWRGGALSRAILTWLARVGIEVRRKTE